MSTLPISVGIAGGGTAGMIAGLMLRSAFPKSDITIIASSDIGIVGVGEGSTEHWREFMERCRIPVDEMIKKTRATHKYGIRFEDWSNAFPDYFHSVSGDEQVFAWGLYGVYMSLIEEQKRLTHHTSDPGLFVDKIRRDTLHASTNQFHFDTFALNQYFSKLCFRRGIKFVDDKITSTTINATTGTIESVNLEAGLPVSADFWIDATGFKRVLSSSLDNTEWNSFSDYLLVDSAFAFPTESDPNGKIRPYTRARAMSSGWVWEIPTQDRRGNGYVFSSTFTTPDKALSELSAKLGRDIEPARSFKFDPGHMKSPWVKNCCAVGLSSSFVEPLEATSIGSTIQMIKLLIPYLASYQPHHVASQKAYNKSFNIMMDNILVMIRLHYMTDRNDTEFWRAAATAKINESLQELLDLWRETTLPRDHIGGSNGEMFRIAHLLHVAQGQNVINIEPISRALDNLNIREWADREIKAIEKSSLEHPLIDHAEALRAL